LNGLSRGTYTLQAKADFFGTWITSVPFTLTVSNDQPSAFDQNIGVPKGVATSFDLKGSDPNGDTLTYIVTESPLHGTLQTFPGSPTVIYTSIAGAIGRDSFKFKVFDGTLYSLTATVYVGIYHQVSAVNAALTPLVLPAPFDRVRWGNDPSYKTAYLQGVEPGRVFQTADEGPDYPVIKAISSIGGGNVGLFQKVSAFSVVELKVTAKEATPVTFYCTGEGFFAENGKNSITVKADGIGTAKVHFNAPASGRIPILVGCPMAVGQVRYVIQIEP
jgi:hypothetical protein